MANIPIAPLPFPPNSYDHRYFNETIRTLNLYFRTLNNPQPVFAPTINLSKLPTSATGLKPGDVWHDTTDNTLKIIPSTNWIVNVIGQSSTASAGTVTV